MSKIPVFIIGINRRSGTNYLYELLTLHPECVKSAHDGEDFIIQGADKFIAFYNKVFSYWSPNWQNSRQQFRKCLEAGILKYLEPDGNQGKYMISKTPSAINADQFHQMFSDGYMIVITRKGQDLVESYSKSFNHRFDDAIRVWNFGARWILKIKNNAELMNSGRVMFVKYEDLYKENKVVMTSVMDFLKLDKSKFDFDKSLNMDVVGSSSFKGNSENVTWKPIPKDKNFNPVNRFAGWSRFKHYRYNWMSGAYSKELGYELYHETSSPVYYVYNFLYAVYDLSFRIFRRIMIIFKSAGKNKIREGFDMEMH